MKKHAPYLIFIAILVALDQTAKFLVAKSVPLHGSVTVLKNFLAISRVHNKGAIFGTFSQARGTLVSTFLLAASVVALLFVVYYFLKTPTGHRPMKIALSLLLAGAIGNQVDRFVRGYVIDFLEVHVKSFYWPTFNVADSCISIGAVLLIALFLFRRA
jgi:signal peptidase II